MNHRAGCKPLYNLTVHFRSWEPGVAFGEHGFVQNLMLVPTNGLRLPPAEVLHDEWSWHRCSCLLALSRHALPGAETGNGQGGLKCTPLYMLLVVWSTKFFEIF